MKKYKILLINLFIIVSIGLLAQSNKNTTGNDSNKEILAKTNSDSLKTTIRFDTSSELSIDELNTKKTSSDYRNDYYDNSNIEESSTKSLVHNFYSIDNFNIWNLISVILCIFSIFLHFLIPRKIIHQTSTNYQQGNEIAQSSNKYIPFDPNEFEKKIRSSSKIEELSNEIHLLKNSPNRNISNSFESVIINDNLTPNIDLNTNKSIFYIYRPIDNYFSISNVQTVKKDTLYKFIVNSHNANESSFELITDGSSFTPTDIAKRNETLIMPACEEENVPGDNIRNITTIRKGTVFLEGDKWIIKSKALIRYE